MAKSNNAYSQEETEKLLSLYDKYGTENLDTIASIMGKTIKSVRSKLVREKVYIAADSQYKRKTGKSKKELLRDLETVIDMDVSGLMGVSKESLINLIGFIEKDEK